MGGLVSLLIVEVRHPQGEPDLLCPVLYCDVCGKRLKGEQNGYCDVYVIAPPEDEDAYFAGRELTDLYVAHGGACFDYLRER